MIHIGPLLAQADSGDDLFKQIADRATTETVVGTVVIVMTTIIGAILIYHLGNRAARRVVARRTAKLGDNEAADVEQRMVTLWVVTRRVLVILLLAVAFLVILDWWNIAIGPFLAVGSVVGIAFGFGAQNLIKDVIAGFFIVTEHQYSVGDVVTINGATGNVEEIALRVTVLRDLEGNKYYVPNGSITVAKNFTQEFASVVVDVGVAYGEDVDHVIQVLAEELAAFHADEEWSRLVLEEPVVLGVNELADWAVTVRVLIKVAADERWVVKREFLRRVKNRLDAEGIEIPFPHTTLVPGDPAKWKEVLETGASGPPAAASPPR